MVGLGGVILRTTNGGASWQTRPSGTTADLYDVQFTSPQHGAAVGKGKILSTADGGETWQNQPVAFSGDLYAVHFAGGTEGWAVGQQGRIFHHVFTSSTLPDPIAKSSLIVAPNPVDGPLHIQLETIEGTSLVFSVRNGTGQVIRISPVRDFQNGIHQMVLDTEAWPGGVYILSIATASGQYVASKKFIKK